MFYILLSIKKLQVKLVVIFRSAQPSIIGHFYKERFKFLQRKYFFARILYKNYFIISISLYVEQCIRY